MFQQLFKSLLILTIAAGFSGCANTGTTSRGRLAGVHSVAVNYADTSPRPRSSTRGGRVAGEVARQGAGVALGFLGLGYVGSLVGIARVAASPDGSEFATDATGLLLSAGTDPLTLLASHTEREIARHRRLTLSRSNPDAVMDFQLRTVRLESVDNRNLYFRATFAATGRLRDRQGATIWKKDAVATSTRTRTWREFSENPRHARADFDALAASIARQLSADLAR